MMRLFRISGICLLFFGLHAGTIHAADIPTKQELFQQQLILYETKTEAKELQEKISVLNQQTSLQEKRVARQTKDVTKQKAAILDTALSSYEGESLSFLMMLFSEGSAERLFTALFFYQEQNEQRANVLVNAKHVLKSYEQKQQTLEKTKQALSRQNTHLQQTLSTLQKQEKTYQQNLALRPNVEQAKKEAALFMQTWETQAVPTFSSFFKSTSRYVGQLDELLTKKHVHKKGFFRYEVRLTDKEFTGFLRKKNAMYEHVTFSFQDDHLIVKGEVNGVHLDMTGNYRLDENKVSFSFSSIQMNGVSLPKGTIQRFQQHYPLTLYPDTFYPGLHIQRVTLQKGTLSMGVTF